MQEKSPGLRGAVANGIRRATLGSKIKQLRIKKYKLIVTLKGRPRFPDSRKFGMSRSLVIRSLSLPACFQYVACGLGIASLLAPLAGIGGNAEHCDGN
jgi:hypothetical protein